ncbi:MAG TPA: PIG-L deacetylase family protein [Candidatus Dormibacteraeota bacterium]|jgi:LmbE family N-acetylglucosaminyl deacetylase|nr:PIG-L deacetylase family protein [Candidatus Dormibacteraeota bacterium]
MQSLNLPWDPASRLDILCLGAHSDDIEIGCGGTILRLARQFPSAAFHWVVFSAIGIRADEAKYAATLFAGTANLKGIHLKQFQDGFMPFVGAEVKAAFEELKPVSPKLIFTHNRKDAHQDHRLLAELTWNTFRDHLILEYEIPKYDGDMGQPGVFVPLESDICQKKVSYLMDSFKSQHAKRWFREDTFLSLMRLRGMECNAPSGYAEAFHCRKLTL